VASAGVLNVPAADTGTSVTNDTITAYFASNIPLAAAPLTTPPTLLCAVDQQACRR